MAGDVLKINLPVTETATAVQAGTERREIAGGVVTWVTVAAVAVLMAVLFADVLLDLASEWWTQPEASYGMLVPPMALYIAYLQRRTTYAFPAQRDVRGLSLVAFGCLVFLLGKLAGEFFLARISFVFVLAGLAWTFWGGNRFKTLAFPFVLLATMVPLPVLVYNAIAAPLQLLASRIATELAQMLGVSIFRDGNIIHLANTSLGVEEACSGLHSLPALVVGALLLGFLANATTLGRILLVLVSVPLAIAVNVLRVTGTAVLADYRPEFAMGFYHSFSGWLVFVLGFGALWLIGQLFFKWTKKTT
jgi:exosortase